MKLQLLQKFSEELKDKYFSNNETFTLTEKIDGVRAVIFNGKVYSRQGREIKGLNHINNENIKLISESYAIDGELLYCGDEKLTREERRNKTISILNEKNGNKKEKKEKDKRNIKFFAFDLIEKESFLCGMEVNNYEVNSTYTYEDRRKLLEKYNLEKESNENIKVIPVLYQGNEYKYIFSILKNIKEEGREVEGLVLNFNKAGYKAKRHYGILKIKNHYLQLNNNV